MHRIFSIDSLRLCFIDYKNRIWNFPEDIAPRCNLQVSVEHSHANEITGPGEEYPTVTLLI